jgi:RNA-directed DNA polymerase
MDTLYIQLASFDSLYHAYLAARKGKRNRAEVAAFTFNLEDELFALQAELRAFMYVPGAYRSFVVHEPKRRLISAAPFRDRVVHHALVQVIEPLFERRFIFDSYANRKGRGTHAALDCFTYFARRFRYVLPCDVREFFPSIDHAILRGQLAHVIRDDSTLWLCDRILDSGAGVLAGEYTPVCFSGDDLFALARPRGLPIGNLTSQFWANVYLDPLDQFIKRRLSCKAYLRYVDDFALFSDDKRELAAWRKAVIERSAALRLTLHEERAQARLVSEGISFLGFRVFPDHRRLNSRRGHYARRHLRILAGEVNAGRLPLAQLSASVRGWAAHAAHGNTWHLRRDVLSKFQAHIALVVQGD